jgi:DNA-binding MarR family transcriptional regulator
MDIKKIQKLIKRGKVYEIVFFKASHEYDIDKAITLSAEEAMVLEELSLEDPALPVKLAAQLLLVPSTVHKCLIRLKEKGLVVNASPPKRKEIIASEVDKYFL